MPSYAFRIELERRIRRAQLCGKAYVPFRDATLDLRLCTYCASTADRMKKCSGCRWAHYCNQICQRHDWPHHMHYCDPDHCLPTGTQGIHFAVKKSAGPEAMKTLVTSGRLLSFLEHDFNSWTHASRPMHQTTSLYANALGLQSHATMYAMITGPPGDPRTIAPAGTYGQTKHWIPIYEECRRRSEERHWNLLAMLTNF